MWQGGRLNIYTRVAFRADGKALMTWQALRRESKPWEAVNLKVWEISLKSLLERACRLANRNLTRAEWQRYLGNETYRPTCPQLPVPEE